MLVIELYMVLKKLLFNQKYPKTHFQLIYKYLKVIYLIAAGKLSTTKSAIIEKQNVVPNLNKKPKKVLNYLLLIY